MLRCTALGASSPKCTRGPLNTPSCIQTASPSHLYEHGTPDLARANATPAHAHRTFDDGVAQDGVGRREGGPHSQRKQGAEAHACPHEQEGERPRCQQQRDHKQQQGQPVSVRVSVCVGGWINLLLLAT